ncbi:MAG: YdeI/OmpD-associated family protein [Eubacteriaceae bacterium]|nr:YdeI/OmpD-associated family protein [Eubacteriaceae bacterium]
MAREVYPVPPFVSQALDDKGLWDLYKARPPYQRNDYIGWITRAKREETRQKRLAQMLGELEGKSGYMGMEYKAK